MRKYNNSAGPLYVLPFLVPA